jgi:hypothetical protein
VSKAKIDCRRYLVTYPDATTVTIVASDCHIIDGMLTLYRDDRAYPFVAAFTPGHWASVEVVE